MDACAFQYDEFRQVGTDYANPDEVAVYEEQHARFRDFDAETAAERVDIQEQGRVLKFQIGRVIHPAQVVDAANQAGEVDEAVLRTTAQDAHALTDRFPVYP